jgi:cobalt/nickel transport system permease protein
MGAHLHLIDHYVKVKSPIHSLDCRLKLIFSLALILCTSWLPAGSWAAYIFLFSILLTLTVLANIDLAYLLKRSILFLPFLLAALPIIFKGSGIAIASFSIGDLDVRISQEGLLRFISLGVKSWLSVSAAIMLASTTSYTELLQAMRSLKIPQLLVAVFGLMWRYLYLMVEEVDRLARARLSRSGSDPASQYHSGGRLGWRARVTGAMAGNLFIRSLERSERVYQAMLSRGYDGEIRTLEHNPPARKDILLLAVTITMMFTLSFLFAYLPGK